MVFSCGLKSSRPSGTARHKRRLGSALGGKSDASRERDCRLRVLTHDLMLLSLWLVGNRLGNRLWPGSWARHHGAGKILRHDMKAARGGCVAEAGDDLAEHQQRKRSDFLAMRGRDGRVVDVHGLRHTFITRPVKAGVNPKEAQALARHSTITLTMDRYAHIGMQDTATAVARVPAIGSGVRVAACTDLAQARVPGGPQESPMMG